ncbi:hypothetical protein EV385_3262 [Krasilnikovia cinnamomea]|uniref:Papain like cysteine protease AvrRpt2 n=1 Tax=Krasilnikovia cinnamomea TaxID=349313 RepID=A0A4Q7ZLG6_9ACTN|nr:hypothetical protein [Krasilnikovia cinnamomea]RZU51434.1 hypothetical protein EV385_3262 [Krasilnikovia cinnamomea]
MTAPTDDQQAAEQYNYGSASWQGGFAQESPSWCFAAIEKSVKNSMGGAVKEQAERAYEVAAALIAIGLRDDDALPPGLLDQIHYIAAVEDADGHKSETELRPYLEVSADHDLAGLLQQVWGAPNFDDVAHVAGGALTVDDMRATIDANGLIAYGDHQHWRIVYGYTVNADSSVQAWVFDPWGGGSYTTEDYDDVRAATQLSYRF